MNLKSTLRAITLELRHELEGKHDAQNCWHPGDLERRLAAIGIRRDRSAVSVDELSHLSAYDQNARRIVDAFIQSRAEAGVERDEAVAQFVRESAYTWANRLLALRCMEARGIIEEVVLQKSAYTGRSLVHSRFLRKHSDAATAEDDGLFAVLFAEFALRAAELPALFDPHVAAVALRPSVAALKRCVALLSGTETVHRQEAATDEVFSAPDAFGWAYQYWNTEEKARVFETVRTKKGTKIAGVDIISATQLYTEPYMVKFLVQNSLGALWMSLHPESKLFERWEYYVQNADRAPVNVPPGSRPVREFTFLDPALGSGHFHLEAFDLLFAMYAEEDPARTPREIAASILNRNLFGIDLDERAVQIAEAALWMKAKDVAPELEAADLTTFAEHLVATNIRLPRGRDHLEAFLREHPEDARLRSALEVVFHGLEHADELGSLLQIEEPVDRELRRLKAEADATDTAPSVNLDLFRATTVQTALPLGVESYNGWKDGALDRLKAHFAQEAETADPARAFFGASARKGLALFNLLARRYDVVAANPPYLGFRKMGGPGHSILKQRYPNSCYDLYAVFIERNLQLARTGGFVAMVTMHSYMYVPSLTELRRALVVDHELEILAHIGADAFEELGDHAPAVLTVLQRGLARRRDLRNITVIPHSTADDKPWILRERRNLKRIPQEQFSAIKGYPFAYNLSPSLLSLFTKFAPLGDVIKYRNGMFTTNNPRFLRFHWEVPISQSRWRPYYKVPLSARWYVPTDYVIDWNNKGDRLKTYSLSKHSTYTFNIVNERHFFSQGVVLKATGSMGPCAKILEPGQICDIESTGIFGMEEEASALVFFHNSRLALYLLHELNPTPHFYISDLERLPSINIDECAKRRLEFLLTLVITEMKALWGDVVTASNFSIAAPRGSSIHSQFTAAELIRLAAGVRLAFCDAAAEQIIREASAITAEDIIHIEAVTDKPEATFPVIRNLAAALTCSGAEFTNLQKLSEFGVEFVEIDLEPHDLENLRTQVRDFYSAKASQTEAAEVLADAEDEVDLEGTTVQLPCETALLEISRAVRRNPLTVAALISDDLAKNRLQVPKMEIAFCEDRFSTLVLRMLGHAWPKQTEAGELLPDWVDRDGVVPITTGSADSALAVRMLDRLGEEYPGGDPMAVRAEFEKIVGIRLEAWLAGSFFARHISKFKKRPIAWQLQSQPAAQSGRRRATTTRGPVFACLIYYQRVDADLLPKLRSHYLGGLRAASETELRTLERLPQSTPDQATRKAELESLLDELERFDARVRVVAEAGFGPEVLRPRLQQLAVADAMLAMKARWLARFCDALEAGPLPEWQAAAAALGHHENFPRWIAEATAHLPRLCANVGAEPPKAEMLLEDPTPATLAAMICNETAAMRRGGLAFVCAEWGREFNTYVIDPLRSRIAAVNEILEQLTAELDALENPLTARLGGIAQEQARLRTELKALRREIKEKTEQAGALSSRICGWNSPVLETWEPWLATSPLFDEISSLDGRRAPPVTIRDFIRQESAYAPDLNDGVRVNIAPLQRAGLLAADVLGPQDVEKAIADRAEWRADERRWCREGKLPRPGWWPEDSAEAVPSATRLTEGRLPATSGRT